MIAAGVRTGICNLPHPAEKSAMRDNEPDFEPPRPRSDSKAWIWIAGIAGVTTIACCGIGTWGVITVVKHLRETVDEVMENAKSIADPVKVQETTASIVDIDAMPAELRPAMQIAFGPERFAVWTSDDHRWILVLTDVAAAGGRTVEGIKTELDNGDGNLSIAPDGGHIERAGKTTREYTIRSEKCAIDFYDGTRQTGNVRAAVKVVQGVIPSKTGHAMLLLVVPADKYDENRVDAFLKSIR
jgi:hypothetical protein